MSSIPDPLYRVFVSSPLDHNLRPNEQSFKHGLYDLLRQENFDLQCFGEAGLPQALVSWTIEEVNNVLSRCQGAVILGYPRWQATGLGYDDPVSLMTEYSHCEGGSAQARKLPILRIRPDYVVERGIMDSSYYLTYLPHDADATWLQDPSFQRDFNRWRDQVNQRFHVFIGYSSGAQATAKKLINFLKRKKVRVLDWQAGFQLGGTILAQIERAETQCLGGIFLFMKDDELVSGDTHYAAPRDNVILEAGYFLNAKSDQRVLIIREEGAKMPADVGGQIYLSLKDRNNISTITGDLLRFVRDRL